MQPRPLLRLSDEAGTYKFRLMSSLFFSCGVPPHRYLSPPSTTLYLRHLTYPRSSIARAVLRSSSFADATGCLEPLRRTLIQYNRFWFIPFFSRDPHSSSTVSQPLFAPKIRSWSPRIQVHPVHIETLSVSLNIFEISLSCGSRRTMGHRLAEWDGEARKRMRTTFHPHIFEFG